MVRWALAILVLSLPNPSATLLLVGEGKARAVILVPDPPSAEAEEAAALLQDHVRQITGASLEIRPETRASGTASPETPWILVGAGRKTKELGLTLDAVGPGGILLRAKGGTLALLGKPSRHAVTTFLENQLGVRYLWPGDSGKVVPRRADIAVEEFELAQTPKLAARRIRMMEYHDRPQAGLDLLGRTKADYARIDRASPGWSSWHRLGGDLKLSGGHAFDGYWNRYGKDHPEWFALQPNGSRDQSASPNRPRLCKSNPELIAAVAREKIQELTAAPELDGVSIAPSDGGRTTFCTCAACEALDAPEGRKVKWGALEHVSYTDRCVFFWNAIAEKVAEVHPKKFLVVDVYSVYSAPPLKRKLHPNLVLRYEAIGGYVDAEARRQREADFDAWAAAAGRFFFRPNILVEGRRTGLPLLYPHIVAHDFRRIVKAGAMGTDFDGIVHHWATQGLNYYVIARLHWDVDQNVDAIIDDYCRAGFGPAAGAVRKYFDACERARLEALEKKIKQVNVFRPEVLAELRGHLEQARRDVGSDPDCPRRLAFLEIGLRWTEAEARATALKENPDLLGPEETKRFREQRFALMREIFDQQPHAVNVALVLWGDGLGR